MSRSSYRSGRLFFGALFALAFFSVGNAAAADEGACSQFKWSIAQERTWAGQAPAAAVKTGDRLPAPPAGAIAVTLGPSAGVAFTVTPGRKAKGVDNGASIAIDRLPKAGRYQVTLSAEAWIDVVQDGAAVPSLDFSGVRDCPGVRKSVRFDLKQGPLLLQLSGSAETRLLLALRPAD